MKIVNVTQSSKEWHEFRQKGIGASEASCLIGANPWKKLDKLIMEKIFGAANFDNPAMKRGRDLEPFVRTYLEKKYGTELLPLCATHETYEFVRASFDGINLEKQMLFEIKCPGERDHSTARFGKMPDKYMPQCQWQLLVSGYKAMTYVSYYENGLPQIAEVVVVEDRDFQKLLLEKAWVAWEKVKESEIPSDETRVIQNPGAEQLITEAIAIQNEIKRLEESLDHIKDNLKIVLGTEEKLKCGEWVLGWTTRKGTVDYSAIDALKEINLDQYRKPDSKAFYFKKAKD